MLTAEERSRFADGLDFDAFDRICGSRLTHHKRRLIDFDGQTGRALRIARSLNLDGARPRDILEIGIGPGYFLFVCRKLGHNVTGIDRPGMRIFPDVAAWLGIETIHHEVKPNERLPVSGRFDLVAAFKCPFHYVRKEDRFWTRAEWSFFFDHLRDDLLKPGGRFVFDIRMQSADDRRLSEHELAMFDTLCNERGGIARSQSPPMVVFDPLL